MSVEPYFPERLDEFGNPFHREEVNGARAEPRPAVESVAVAAPLAETVATFRKWLHLPDPAALLAVLGTVAANRLEGDPVWTVLVGPPGGGKSEILQSLGGLEDVHPVATLTEPALLSGTAKKERDSSARGAPAGDGRVRDHPLQGLRFGALDAPRRARASAGSAA